MDLNDKWQPLDTAFYDNHLSDILINITDVTIQNKAKAFGILKYPFLR